MDRAIEAAVQNLLHFGKTYAISGILSTELFSADIFFFNHTFARHRPKNGAAATIANAILNRNTHSTSPVLSGITTPPRHEVRS